ncbi:MAG: hypothetical protein LBP61_02945 [Desulfovibrio sp.]|nr:hypothetical protein [Desulfovibrio sp.]
MVFLYSRKPQLVLLLFWSIALAGMFAYATGNEPFFFFQKSDPVGPAKARLGELPPAQEPPADPGPLPEPSPKPELLEHQLPAHPEPAHPEPVHPEPVHPEPARSLEPAPNPEAKLNLGTALRVFPKADGDERKLVLEFDYTAAQENGFSPDKAHTFYTDDLPPDSPSVVIVLGSPWKLDLADPLRPLEMKQATRASLWLTKSRQLRLVTHTRTATEAAGAKVRISPTQTGLRAEIHFSR